jgi:hypothetical protein
MPAFALPPAPGLTYVAPSLLDGTLPYPRTARGSPSRGFGGRLEPRYIVGAEPLDQ